MGLLENDLKCLSQSVRVTLPRQGLDVILDQDDKSYDTYTGTVFQDGRTLRKVKYHPLTFLPSPRLYCWNAYI